jgi:uncharacterized membrane protein
MSKTQAVVCAFVILGGLGVGFLATAASFIRRHVSAEPASADAAATEIESQAARFVGQQPLRDIRDGQAPVPHWLSEGAQEPGRSVKALISDVRSRRVVRVDVPLAVLRVAKRRGFRYLGELTPLLADTEFEADRVDLPLGDIDRHGPILVVDHAHASDARILMWVE